MATTKTWVARCVRLAPMLAGLAGGCAGARPHESFPVVAGDVNDRIGYAVHWHDGSPADRSVDDRVAALLARPLDADTAVQVALLNNRRLQATYESLGIAQADLAGAGLLRNPVFDAAYRFGEAGASARISFGLTFDFVDLLFLHVRKDLAAAELESTKAAVTARVLDLASDVRAAVYATQAAEQTVTMRQQVAKAAAAAADFARRLREAGNTTELEADTQRARQAEADLDLTRARGEAAAARERLNGLLGAWGPQTRWTIAGSLPDPKSDEPAADGIERQAVAKSLDLRMGRAQVASALRRLGVAEPMGVLSQLETGISADREGGEWYTGPTIALPIPIFSQGQPAAARAAAQVRQAEADLYATAVEVRSAARAAYARVVLLRQQVDAMRQTLLPLRAAIVKQTQLHYNAMQIGTFDLLLAKREQIEADAAYVALLRDYWTAKASLESILSGRTPRGTAGESPTASNAAGMQ